MVTKAVRSVISFVGSCYTGGVTFSKAVVKLLKM